MSKKISAKEKNAIIAGIREDLFALQDNGYRDFHAALVPNLSKDVIIGVRTPVLRDYAKKLASDSERAAVFLESMPHKYYEEKNLHAFLLERTKDFDESLRQVCAFLPEIDNWATCDCKNPKVFAKHPDELLPYIRKWIASGETYTIRYAVNLLMRFYLKEHYRDEYVELVAGISSEEYYVKMVVAWYMATAMVDHYDAVLKLLKEERMDRRTHNKSIQKACESYRITPEQKAELKLLRRK